MAKHRNENELLRRYYTAIQKYWRDKSLQVCLAEDAKCDGTICRAHSVPLAGALKRIAKDGHVYMFRMTAGGAKLVRIGINKATTFTGFCGYHDARVFKEIDFSDGCVFNPKNIRQCVLLALRSVAREYWAKANAVKIYDKLVLISKSGDVEAIKKMLDSDDEGARTFASNVDVITGPYLRGSRLARNRLRQVFGSVSSQINNNKFHLSKIETYCVRGSQNIAASSLCLPEFDLSGKRICFPRPGDSLPEVAASAIPQDDITWIVFWYHKKFSRMLVPLFDQFRKLCEEERKIAFSRFFLIYSENVAYSPSYVGAISEDLRINLENSFEKTLYLAKPYDDVPSFDVFSGEKKFN